MSTPILDIRGLRTHFRTEAGVAKAVDGVDLSIYPGEVLAGWRVRLWKAHGLSVLRLIGSPAIVPRDCLQRQLLKLSYDDIRKVRARGSA